MVTHSVRILMYGSSIVVISLIVLLCWEYNQLRAHSDTMRRLHEHYVFHIKALKEFFQHKTTEMRVQHEEQMVMPPESARTNKDTLQEQQKDNQVGIQFVLPIERSKFWVSSLFGNRKKPNGQREFHAGLDLAAVRGTVVTSVAAGVIEQAENVTGYGNTVLICHDMVYKTRYAHLDSIAVAVGDEVKQGEQIGKVGDTGSTRKTGKDASHLHFELYEHGIKINPAHVLTL